MVLLSIIILSYNTKDLTVACLKSIFNRYGKQLEGGEFEVLVVDNNSTDGTQEGIKNYELRIKNFKLIINKDNLGFSRGNNIGAKEAKGKYLFFLNSDTEVLDDGLLKMIQFLDNNQQVGVLGVKLVNPDGTDQKSAGKFYNLFNVFLMLFGGERLGLLRFSPNNQKSVDWVSGAAMIINKELFDKINGFDEKLFMYMEDMELCYRVKINNCQIVFYPNIKILHKSLGSSNKTFAIVNIYKGLLYFYKKHSNYFSYIMMKDLLYKKAILAILIGMLTKNDYL
ncbi:MAG: glycosyltransferase family 2 protein, partial [Candidatus Levybacteria bacterium]|nr:glycosyltransferase family 2 protein [Candidatus Levybacteria bacterium]